MNYGFIVVAFLIIPMESTPYPVPFATMEACRTAEALYKGMNWRGLMHCVATGATTGKINIKIEWDK